MATPEDLNRENEAHMHATQMKTKRTMTVKEALAERARGAAFWRSLDKASQHELGDQLVLGCVDYLGWFERRPSAAFLNGLDEARILSEMEE
ncbi:MAG TPA: hypothetical protein VD948_02900 [Rhodothermales bacterium]|nr:hypothetical protein [Rhodothermales bacterium]